MKKTMKNIKNLCDSANLDFDVISKASKEILSLYRQVYWELESKISFSFYENKENTKLTSETACIFLSKFSPTDVKKHFNSKTLNILETKLLLLIIYDACDRLKSFPNYGEIYYQIIYNYYISDPKHNDEYSMRKLLIGRSIYYQRKKEATILLGIIIWGYSIPTAISLLKDGINVDDLLKIS